MGRFYGREPGLGKICSQIALMQIIFYTSYSLFLFIGCLVFGAYFHPDLLLSPPHLNFVTVNGLMNSGCVLLAAVSWYVLASSMRCP